MKEILYHKINKSAIREWKKVAITTKVWNIPVECKDGTQDWIPLKDLKEYNLVETAKYSDADKLLEEPSFKWWLKSVQEEGQDNL